MIDNHYRDRYQSIYGYDPMDPDYYEEDDDEQDESDDMYDQD